MYFYAFTFFMYYVLVLLVDFYVLVFHKSHSISSILAIKETGNHNIFQKEILWSISRNSKNNKTSRHKMVRIIFSRLLQALEATHSNLTWEGKDLLAFFAMCAEMCRVVCWIVCWIVGVCSQNRMSPRFACVVS